MSYNPSIPQPGDLLSQSQSDILNNFTALNAVLNVNTGVLNLPINNTGPTTAASTVALYSKNNTQATPIPALFWRQQSSGTEIDFTTANLTSTGWCQLPCGLKMVWSRLTATSKTNVTFTFSNATGFPGFSTVFNAQVSLSKATGQSLALYYTNFSTTSVDVYNTNSAGSECCVLVMGV